MATIIEGVVLHETEWAPLFGVTVYAYSTNGYTEGSDITDSNGHFLISGLTDRDWLAKIGPGQSARVLLVPMDVGPIDHAQLQGIGQDDHQNRQHLTQHHTGGDDSLSLDLIAGTIVGPGHGDMTGEALAIHAPTDLVGGNWKVPYSDGSGNVQELALPADALVYVGAGVAAAPVFEEIFTTHILTFSSVSDSPSVNDILDGFPNGICVGESGEHGTFTAIRAKCTVDDANKGTGTNTLVVEADDNPAFSTATVLFTLPINALGEVDDTGLDNAWASGDIHIRARWTAVATAPEHARVMFYFKERVEAF